MKGIPDRIDYDLDSEHRTLQDSIRYSYVDGFIKLCVISTVLFCGINPGVRSSQEGFHYAHPSNRFYRILHESGLTPHRLKPSESLEMPKNYKLGLTDLVLRCTARAEQVPSMEFRAGATLLLRKMIEYRPKM
jgi:mismatch-specific thymine-DNA glycosylase